MLQWRAALGYSASHLRQAMISFDRFCAARHPGETVLTRELAVAWCQDTPAGPWSAHRGSAARAFGQYLQRAGAEAFVMPSGWNSRPARPLPHLPGDEELAAFFQAADTIGPEYRSPFREYTLPVIFRLILGAGLRPQEARWLRRAHVDLAGAMLLIENSKGNKDRRIPVDEGLAGLLARYDYLAEAWHPGREWFFENQPGRQLGASRLTFSYHLCRERAGGIAPGTTPYTLRHVFASRTLMRWVEEGRDLQAWLPYLAAYMGHREYASTAWYVHLLPERLDATGLTSADGILPEVTP